MPVGQKRDVGCNDNRSRRKAARFHLGDGARLERVDWLGNTAQRGIRECFGITVNYDHDSIEANHAFVHDGTIARSADVDALLSRPN